MKKLMTAAVLAMTLGSAANAAVIYSSGFENSLFTDTPFETAGAGSSLGDGWTVTGHSVDVINGYWPAQSGEVSVDLNGNGQGGVITTLTNLIVNKIYTVSFWLGANPDGDPDTKTVNVGFGGQFETVTNGPVGQGPFWSQYVIDFTADATTLDLSFASADPGFYGAALDSVTVSAVPLPAAGLLLVMGLGGLVMLRRRAV